jgi:hypothetical protein
MEGDFFVLAEANLLPLQPTGPMTWQRPYEKPRGQFFGQTEDCDAHSLSVFAEVADLRNARDFTPWMRRKSIAMVRISRQDGRLKRTPTPEGDSHHNWWTDPHTLIPSATVIEGRWPE